MFENIVDSYHKFIFSFSRDVFYSDLADTIRRRVSLKKFAEVMGNNGEILSDSNSVHIARMITTNIENEADVTLESSIHPVVPASDLPLLRAAEISQNVADSVVHLSKVVSFKNRLRKALLLKIVSLIVIIAMSVGISWLTAGIIDQIVQTAPHVKFVGFNGFIIWLTDFLMKHWMTIGITFISVIWLLVYGSSRFTGPLRTTLDELPLLSVYRNWHSANDIAALAMFLSSGLVLKEAINKLSDGASRWRQWQVEKLTESLDNSPNELLKAFSQGMFSPELRARLASLSESTNSFEDAVINLGSNELDRVEQGIGSTLTIFSSVMIGVIASIAILLSIGQNTIIIQLQNDFTRGF